jgi:hypothetical protein
MTLTDDLNWLKTHLILLAIMASLIFGGVYGVLNVIEKHDAKAAAQAQVQATLQAKQNQDLQAVIASKQLQLVQDRAALQAEEAKIETLLSQRAVVEKALPKANASLTAQEAAIQISKFTKGNATPSGSSVTVDTPTAQVIVTELELVPLLEADKADLTKQVLEEKSVSENIAEQLSLEQKSHKSDVAALTSQVEADKKEITFVKAEARKGKLKWFGIGYVAGFLTRTILVP